MKWFIICATYLPLRWSSQSKVPIPIQIIKYVWNKASARSPAAINVDICWNDYNLFMMPLEAVKQLKVLDRFWSTIFHSIVALFLPLCKCTQRDKMSRSFPQIVSWSYTKREEEDFCYFDVVKGEIQWSAKIRDDRRTSQMSCRLLSRPQQLWSL